MLDHSLAVEDRHKGTQPARPAFDPVASRDLEQIEVADGHLRQAWKDLTPVARRSVVAAGCILEIAAMQADLQREQRRIEAEAGL